MRKIHLSTVAAIAGAGAIALFSAPSFAAADQRTAKVEAPVQLTQMMGQSQQGQGQPGQAAGQPCSGGAMGHGADRQGMMGHDQRGQGMKGHGQRGQGMMGQGMMGQGMMGQGMMGQGMMGHGQRGQGMMGKQGMMGHGMMGQKSGKGSGLGDQVVVVQDLTTENVSHFLQHRLEMHGNKRLIVGDVKESGEDKIIADITTVDGSLVQRLEIDRHTGKMQQIE